MRLIPFRNSHSRFVSDVDAFVDGELRGDRLAAFNRHLSSCATCTEAVSNATAVKALMSALPERPAPRSFALTAEMAASPARERVPAVVGTPLYLGMARLAAAVAVVAFVGVFTLSLIGGDSKSSDQSLTSANAERNAAPQAADNSAGGSSSAATPTAASSSAYAAGSPTALLAPASPGAVSGAAAPSASPVPPSTGAQTTPVAPQPNDGSVTTKSLADGTALGDAVAIEPARAGGNDNRGSDIPWTIVMGCVAGAFIGILVVAESRRRRD